MDKKTECEIVQDLLFGYADEVLRRTFTFAAIVVVGDGNGVIGYGLGKAGEVTDRKSTRLNSSHT